MSAAAHESPIDIKHAWRALWALLIGFFMILVDTTIVSVSIPTIMSQLHTDVESVIWVSSAYLLTYAVPLLITGRLGDRFGPKNLFMLGLLVFTLSSAWCGLATSIGSLIVARGVQGLGASMISPQSMSLITRMFPPDKRGGAMGVWGATAGVATLVGPILGGLLLDWFGWPAIFWVNVPVGVIGLFLAWRLVPKVPTHPHSFDLLGVLLNGAAVFCLVFGLQEGESHHWEWKIWALMGAGLLLMAAFVAWQAKNRREPLLPLELFRNRNFSVANLAIFAMGVLITAMSFPMMLYVQACRGLSPTRAALMTAPTALVSLVLAPLVGRYINTHDPRHFPKLGFALFAGGLGLYALLVHPGVSVLWLLIPAAITGLASSFIWGPLSTSATRDLPWQHAGAGAGVYNATRQLGAVLGSAAVAALITQQLGARMPQGAGSAGSQMNRTGRLPEFLQSPFSAAMATSMLLPIGAALVGLLVSFLLQRHSELGARSAPGRSSGPTDASPRRAADGVTRPA